MYRPEAEIEKEKQFSEELKRELSPAEREFLETEKEHAHSHHERMAQLIDQYPNFKVLFIDATDKGTVGSDFFTELNPELLNYITQIHTGQDFPSKDFDYKKFAEQLFRYMLGFKPNDPRFETIRTIKPGSTIPTSTAQYNLVVGSGGEVNQLDTQSEYTEQLEKIKAIFKQILTDQTPFLLTCATHQIMGELVYELNGGSGTIIETLHDEQGNAITESGVIDLFVTDEARTHPLAAELPDVLPVMSNHGECLTEIPQGATSLAGNRFQGKPITTQLIGYEDGSISIQGHPEFSPAINIPRNYLDRAMAAWQGQELPPIAEVDPRPTWEAREILFPKVIEFAAKRKQKYNTARSGV